MMLIPLILAAMAVQYTSADYSCLCSYHVERPVYAKPNVSSSVEAYMYEFDCKPVIESASSNLDPKWVPIAVDHKINYVLKDAQITQQVCPGSPSALDTITSSPATESTTKYSTPIKPSSEPSLTTSKPSTHRSSTFTTSSTLSTPQTTTPQTTYKASTTKRTTISTQKRTSKLPATESTTQKMVSTPQSLASTTQRTFTSQSTASTMKTSISTAPSLTPTTKRTIVKQTTSSTTTGTIPATRTRFTTKATAPTLPSLSTKIYKPTTTDWTLVPWATHHHNFQKTTHPPAHHHKTTYHASHHHQTTHGFSQNSNKTVNVGNLHLCPRSIVRQQEPGTRNLRQHGQYCYELRLEQQADWIDAREDCFSYANGFIVQIMNQRDQDFIMQFLREENIHVPIWIGLNDKGHEEHFFWDSGARVTYTNWDPQRKDNEAFHGQEDCGVLKTNGLWDDTICRGYLFSDHHHPWICQYHIRHQGG